MLELRMEPWSGPPQARWVLSAGLLVVLATLVFFALPTLTDIRFGVEAFPTSFPYECVHALQNGVLAVACLWVFLRRGGGMAPRRPVLMILVVLLLGVGGDLLLHRWEAAAIQAAIEHGSKAVFSSAMVRTLTAVAPYTPPVLWLPACGLAVWAAGRRTAAVAQDAYVWVVLTQALTLAGGMLGVLVPLQLLMVAVAPVIFRMLVAQISTIYFFVPLALALLAGGLVVPRWPERLRHAGAFDLLALGVLMGLLPGVPCVLLLQVTQVLRASGLYALLPAMMLGLYLVGIWGLAWGAVRLVQRGEAAQAG